MLHHARRCSLHLKHTPRHTESHRKHLLSRCASSLTATAITIATGLTACFNILLRTYILWFCIQCARHHKFGFDASVCRAVGSVVLVIRPRTDCCVASHRGTRRRLLVIPPPPRPRLAVRPTTCPVSVSPGISLIGSQPSPHYSSAASNSLQPTSLSGPVMNSHRLLLT